jgi:hypothetical protein
MGIYKALRTILLTLEYSTTTAGKIVVLTSLAPAFPEPQSQAILAEAISIVYKQESTTTNRNFGVVLDSVLPRFGRFFPLAELKLSEQETEHIARQVAIEAKVILLITLIPRLSEDNRSAVLHDFLATIRSVEDESLRIGYLLKLMPYLPESLQRHVLQNDFTLDHNEDSLGIILLSLPKLCDSVRKEFLIIAIDRAQAIESAKERVAALARLIPHLTDSLQDEVLRATYTNAQAIESTKERVAALAELIPHLTDSLQDEVLRATYTNAQAIESTKERVAALAELIPHLTGPLQDEVLRVTYNTAVTIENEKAGWEVVKVLAPIWPRHLIQEAFTEGLPITGMETVSTLLGPLYKYLMDLDIASLYSIWKRMLHVLASSTRQEFLAKSGNLTEAIKKLGSETAVVATVEAIETVRQWWP